MKWLVAGPAPFNKKAVSVHETLRERERERCWLFFGMAPNRGAQRNQGTSTRTFHRQEE